MANRKQQDTDAGSAGQRQDDAAPDSQAEADALNDARALQQMIEGVPDSSDEFTRIGQKR